MKKLFFIISLFSIAGMFGMERNQNFQEESETLPTQQEKEDALRTKFADAQAENNSLKEWYHQKNLPIPQTLSLFIDTLKVQQSSKKPLTKEDLTTYTKEFYVHSSIHLATPQPIFPQVNETELKKLEAENTRLRRYAQTQGYDNVPQPSSSRQLTNPILLVNPVKPTPHTFKQPTPAELRSLLSIKSSINMKPKDCSLSHK